MSLTSRSKAVPEASGSVPYVTMEEVRRMMSEAVDKYSDKWTSHYSLRPEYQEEKSNTN